MNYSITHNFVAKKVEALLPIFIVRYTNGMRINE